MRRFINVESFKSILKDTFDQELVAKIQTNYRLLTDYSSFIDIFGGDSAKFVVRFLISYDKYDAPKKTIKYKLDKVSNLKAIANIRKAIFKAFHGVNKPTIEQMLNIMKHTFGGFIEYDNMFALYKYRAIVTLDDLIKLVGEDIANKLIIIGKGLEIYDI